MKNAAEESTALLLISYNTKIYRYRNSIFGAEGETRTLAPVTRPTPLAGAPRHQLEYFCKCNVFKCIL